MKKKGLWLVSSVLLVLGLMMSCTAPTVTPTTPVSSPTVPVSTPTLKPTPVATPTAPVPTATPTAEIMKVELKFLCPWPETGEMGEYAKGMMKAITEQSGGKITFKTYYGTVLGTDSETLGLLTNGVVDMAGIACGYWPGQIPLSNIGWVFPFTSPSSVLMTEANWRIREAFPQFRQEQAKYNYRGLLLECGQSYNLLAKKPFYSLDEMKGKKVGAMGRYFGRWIQASGMVPVTMTGPDKYGALQSGTIELDCMTPILWYGFKMQELASYMIEANMGSMCTIDWSINLNTWNRLNQPTQQLIIDASLKEQKRLSQWVDDGYKSDIQRSGFKVIPLPTQDRDKWISMIEDIPAEWAAEVEKLGYPGSDIVAKFQDICAQLGYTWPRRWGVRK